MPRNILTNHYIQKQQLNEAFLASLQERRIEAKFQYIGEQQANAWLKLCESPEYDYYRNSKKLLEHTAEHFTAYCNNNVNVIVLGPGNALKEKLVVQALQRNHQVHLFFVDTSKEMLNIAVKNVADTGALEQLFVADLMNVKDIAELSRYIRKQYNATSFFTCLGNTLGNYPQAMMLKTIRHAMAPGDKMLMDIHLKVAGSTKEEALHIDETIKQYDNAANREGALTLLSEVGITATDGTVEVVFEKDQVFPQMDLVKRYFRFTLSKTITYQGEDIYFTKGERILVSYSSKYTFTFLEHLLTARGLCIVENAQSETGKIHQLLCELA